jgi:NADH-quinone oxidoreductase subunit F
MCYKVIKSKGITLGSGAILVIDDSNCAVDFAKCIAEFFLHESCGKCAPCRHGNQQLVMILEKFTNGTATQKDYKSIGRIASTMKYSSFCGLGQTAATPLSTILKCCKSEFDAHLNKSCYTNTCSMAEGEK